MAGILRHRCNESTQVPVFDLLTVGRICISSQYQDCEMVLDFEVKQYGKCAKEDFRSLESPPKAASTQRYPGAGRKRIGGF